MKRTNKYESVEANLASPRRRVMLGLAGTFAAVGLAFGLSTAAPAVFADETSSAADSQAAATQTSGSSADVDSITLAEDVAAKASPSVGTVQAVIETPDTQGIALGSCVLIDEDGHLLTNYHVIEGAVEIQVTINDTDYQASVVGSDPSSDLAVLEIAVDENTPDPIEIGSSDDVNVGEWVMTIGAPKGESQSVSQGIVSGLSRTASYDLDTAEAIYTGLIQTDAMINSGSSGGALVNAEGQLIGITTLSATTTGDWAGMSYAIPSDYAMSVANQIIETGVVQHPFLGVSLADVTPYNYQQAGSSSYWGAYVGAVEAGGPAEEAGIQVGDVITAIDGETVDSTDAAIIAVRSHEIGETVTVTVERDGEPVDIDVTLGSDNESAGEGDAEAATDDSQDGGSFSFFGGNDESDGGASDEGSGDSGSWGSSDGGWGWGSSGNGSWGFWSNPEDSYGYGGGYGYGPFGGYGYGDGGYGYGSGYGSGYGYGDYGYGNGSGYGYGYGYGDGGTEL